MRDKRSAFSQQVTTRHQQTDVDESITKQDRHNINDPQKKHRFKILNSLIYKSKQPEKYNCLPHIICLFVLFDLILNVPSTIFQLNRDRSLGLESSTLLLSHCAPSYYLFRHSSHASIILFYFAIMGDRLSRLSSLYHILL